MLKKRLILILVIFLELVSIFWILNGFNLPIIGMTSKAVNKENYLLPYEESSGSPYVVLIYLDGAEWNVINKMMDNGYLPTFKFLKENGYYGSVTQEGNPGNPASTTEMITGVTREYVGVRGWNTIDEISGAGRQVKYTDIKYPVIWDTLSEQDNTIGVYGWWAAYPPSEINGFIFNTELVPNKKDACYPSDLTSFYDRDEHETENAWNIINSFSEYYNGGYLPNFLAISFHRIDIAQHMMWISIEPEYFTEYFENVNDVTEKYGIERKDSFIANEYILLDNFLNKTLSLYSNKTDDLYFFVVSEHGFKSVLPTGQTDLYPLLKDVGLMNYTPYVDMYGRYLYKIEKGTKLYRCMPFLPRTNSNAKFSKFESGKLIYQIIDEDFCFGDEPITSEKAIQLLSSIEYKCSGMPFFANMIYNEELNRIQGERVVDFRCLGEPEIRYGNIDDASAKGNFYYMTLPSTLIFPNSSEYEFELGPLKTGCHPPNEVVGMFMMHKTGMTRNVDIGVIETVDIAPTILKLYGLECGYCNGSAI